MDKHLYNSKSIYGADKTVRSIESIHSNMHGVCVCVFVKINNDKPKLFVSSKGNTFVLLFCATIIENLLPTLRLIYFIFISFLVSDMMGLENQRQRKRKNVKCVLGHRSRYAMIS